jgi:hypothetical protein
MTLRDFAAVKKRACKVCILPRRFRDQVDDALRNGVAGAKVITTWLVEEGFANMSRWHIQHHRDANHHNPTMGPT